MAEVAERLSIALADRYRIERELGAGGMATVYLAQDLKHHRHVALKVLRPDLASALGPDRFLREIELAARLTHPHILPLHDSGEAAGFLYYVMPYIQGESLRDRLQREGALPIPDAVRLLRDVVDALAKSHAEGVVHRDIKPDNVMIADRHALVTDFGVAKAVSAAKGDQGLTTVGVAVGTPAYMSPEQAAGDPHIDHRADLYAVGVMAYEMLTGHPPFTGESYQATLAAHVSATPEPVTQHREQIPPLLADLVMRCLAKNPADRWQRADEMLAVLDTLALTPSGSLTPAVPSPSFASAARRWALPSLAVGAVVIAGALWLGRGPGAAPVTTSASDNRAIAVLPFINVGGGADDEYFADGMTDELTSALAKVPDLRVAARSSAFTFKGRTVDAREVGQRLSVTHVLEGSVRRSGSRLRVSAQLVNAADGLQQWSETFEREAGDAFAIQDDITGAIVNALELELGGLALAVARAGRTDDPVAHDLLLQGNFHLFRASEAELNRAIALYREAAARDPGYALPWARIALAYGALADAFLPPQVAYAEARTAAERALALDSLIPDAHAMLGYARYSLDWDFAGAEASMRRAVELDPNATNARFVFGIFLCGMGRHDEGLANFERAIALDPLSTWYAWGREMCLYYARRFEDLANLETTSSSLDSTFFYHESYPAAGYRELGRYEEALAEYRRATEVAGATTPYGLAATYARMGRTNEARAALGEIEARHRQGFVSRLDLAVVYATLGNVDSAVALLEQAYAARETQFLTAPQYAELQPAIRDPRIQRLLREAGLVR
ncbi:MAG: protein kinase [Gemmatimonadota bacterium]|nr:protein kinase [Gemmatimonadota bacterium]